MAQELQRQTEKPLTFGRQPEEFLTQLGCFMETMQDAYRQKLSEAEQVLWRETLMHGEDRFSIQELHAALAQVVRNPPLMTVDGPDGPVSQAWRGMPKLPDLVDVMLRLREERADAAEAERKRQRDEEFERLKKRRAEHPEEFFGFADVLKTAQERGIAMTRDRDGIKVPGKTMPTGKPREQSEADYSQRQRELERQKKELLK
jgi:hypothetical protein